jgi:polyphenol oxidase
VTLATLPLGGHARAWFTGRDVDAPTPPIGQAGNLSHRRPHRPDDLARARRTVADHIGVPADTWHHMSQVHGAEVATVTAATPVGAELRGVDALVTAEPGRALVVQTADCVPLLLAGGAVTAAVHAGRSGVTHEVVEATLGVIDGLGVPPGWLRAVIGPAIGGCCYEVPPELQEEVVSRWPAAAATTRWGTPSLDLAAAVTAQLSVAGVDAVERVAGCTRCDREQRWFSHRRDPAAGRQVGIVVRAPESPSGWPAGEPTR